VLPIRRVNRPAGGWIVEIVLWVFFSNYHPFIVGPVGVWAALDVRKPCFVRVVIYHCRHGSRANKPLLVRFIVL